MITIDDGPDPYSRAAVAEPYVRDGLDVTVYPPVDACPDDVLGTHPFAIAQGDEETVVIYIIDRRELNGNVALMKVVERAETRPDLRVDIQFVEQGDDQVRTSEVSRVANATLRKARRLFMNDQKRRSFTLLANEIQRLLQSHIADDQNGATWAELADRIQLDDQESLDVLLRSIISAPVSSDEELENLAAHFDRLESLCAALLRYDVEPARPLANPAVAS